MRPERLELEGFTAFRDRVIVDFSGAELFALVGPTGSGKSSIVDAITFALYGSVPRLAKGRVQPIVSLGTERARVRFDFSVGDKPYTAVRVVQRTKTGATTSEARLEGGDTDIVGADQLTEAVEDLLGLSFEHFTKSVVLPQGEFASFLLDGPKERQALLRELLNLGRYTKVRELAKNRETRSGIQAEALREQLKQLESVDAEAVDRLKSTLADLQTLDKWMGEHRTRSETVKAEVAALQVERGQLSNQIAALRNASVPEGVKAMAADMTQATGEVEALTAAVTSAEAVALTAERVAEEAGDPAIIATTLELIGRTEELTERIDKGKALIEENSQAEAEGRSRVAAAEKVAATAQSELGTLETRHRAHAVRETLAVGDICPVCESEVTLPASVQPVGLETARAAADTTNKELEDARRQLATLGERRTANIAHLETLQSDQSALAARIGSEDRATLGERQAEIDTTKKALGSAQERLASLRKDLAASQRRGAALDDESAALWSGLDRLRISLATLEPPEISRKDLGKEWAEFIEWASARMPEIETRITDVASKVDELSTTLNRLEQEAVAEATKVGVEVGDGDDLSTLVITRRAMVSERLDRMQIDLAAKTGFAANLEGYETDVTVAKSLVRHLNVNGFERWLIEEVMVALVDEANELLAQLSQGAYSLAVESADFVVIDHLNADERRSARTLSGGETFVVSLALALSLARQLAEMSVTGTARLESVFLDEGFGTLDPETLDTVAAVIHELGSDGRTVGIITHVAELALQIPVRFEVTKRSGTATVERVEI